MKNSFSVSLHTAGKLLSSLIRAGKVAFLAGPIGIGKSALVEQVAANLGYTMIDVRLGQMHLTEVIGIPVKIEDPVLGDIMQYAPNWFIAEALRIAKQGGKPLLFLDEFNLAPPALQAVTYQLLLNRRIANNVLPESTAIVAAGNREEDFTNVHSMPPAVLNRLVYIEIEPDVEEWISWAFEHNINPTIIAFVRAFRLLHTWKKGLKNFATPRSYAALDDILKANEIKLEDLPPELVNAVIGVEAGEQLMGYAKTLKDIKAESLLDMIFKGEKVEIQAQQVDVVHAIIVMAAQRYKSAHSAEKKAKMMANYLQWCNFQFAKEKFRPLAGYAFKEIASADPKTFHEKIKQLDEWKKFVQQFGSLIV
jgi:MoxR-like ATPase